MQRNPPFGRLCFFGMLFFLLCVPPLSAQSISSDTLRLKQGIGSFGEGRYNEALEAFAGLLGLPKNSQQRAEALYWSALSYVALDDRVKADALIDLFIADYPEGGRLHDLEYQRGRIQYQNGEYEAALGTFGDFIQAAPNHDLAASALYWSGECFFALGRLEEADKAFAAVIGSHPSSVKVEAASYRRSIIELSYRERELLRLLSWSHEEALRAADDFRRRERAYEQSIALYQKQLADAKRAGGEDSRPTNTAQPASAAPADPDNAELRAELADLGSRLSEAESRLSSALAENQALKRELEGRAGSFGAGTEASAPVGGASPTSASPTSAAPADPDNAELRAELAGLGSRLSEAESRLSSALTENQALKRELEGRADSPGPGALTLPAGVPQSDAELYYQRLAMTLAAKAKALELMEQNLRRRMNGAMQ